ncbi:hypothetical protein Taro_010123 [Colocasia esculenta]|uniref:F-box/LRR-repeat protein 15-like leucin rich repeat domain-containing protein n=1 Tax=Colocasia esculenta TaxID=4460 RepID=A0A843U8M3_COLES|nr:hypothetical protein [Colocasia esculenta]
MEEEPPMDLPEDLWALVFRRLGDERWWEPLSLVCRRFLFITNGLRSDLTITDRTKCGPGPGPVCSLPRLFRRFPNLRRIAVHDFRGDLDRLFREIACSDLKVEALDLSRLCIRFPRSAAAELAARKGDRLRTLILARFFLLEKDDVLAIAELFPNLEELDISQPQEDIDHAGYLHEMVNDEAIAVLSSKLRNLRSIRLSGNHFLSDNALVLLASNCPMLTEVVAHDCSFMGGSGIAFALRECQNLTSVSVNKITDLSLGREKNLFFHATALRRLCLSRMGDPDKLLISIGEAGLPLQEFCLSECPELSFAGFSAVMQSCGRSLRHLALANLPTVCDESMVAVLPYLSNLNSIHLSNCCDLSNITFFGIVKNCVSIEKIEMVHTKLGRGVWPADLFANRTIRSLNLASNRCLDDNTLQHIAAVCPQLRSLDLNYCWDVTGEGLGKVGEVCREVRDLSMKGCSKIKNLGTGSGFLKLETLQVGGSGFEDEALLSIAANCKQLSWLHLTGCSGVTKKGVKEIVRKCQRLQQLSMGSRNVDANVLSWIVFSRPFLRKIEWQSGVLPVKVQDLFLRHGCMSAITVSVQLLLQYRSGASISFPSLSEQLGFRSMESLFSNFKIGMDLYTYVYRNS